jgi:hypothetical protein
MALKEQLDRIGFKADELRPFTLVEILGDLLLVDEAEVEVYNIYMNTHILKKNSSMNST